MKVKNYYIEETERYISELSVNGVFVGPFHIKDCHQTEEKCLIAVRRYGWIIKHVKNPTMEIYLAAFNQCNFAINYVPVQTEELCLAAVKINGNAIFYVKDQTEAICVAAVKQDVRAIHYIHNTKLKTKIRKRFHI